MGSFSISAFHIKLSLHVWGSLNEILGKVTEMNQVIFFFKVSSTFKSFAFSFQRHVELLVWINIGVCLFFRK